MPNTHTHTHTYTHTHTHKHTTVLQSNKSVCLSHCLSATSLLACVCKREFRSQHNLPPCLSISVTHCVCLCLCRPSVGVRQDTKSFRRTVCASLTETARHCRSQRKFSPRGNWQPLRFVDSSSRPLGHDLQTERLIGSDNRQPAFPPLSLSHTHSISLSFLHVFIGLNVPICAQSLSACEYVFMCDVCFRCLSEVPPCVCVCVCVCMSVLRGGEIELKLASWFLQMWHAQAFGWLSSLSELRRCGWMDVVLVLRMSLLRQPMATHSLAHWHTVTL
ncbi:unnamed protein product [Protopolystoma xenopodis]|uniref:Uncharacterized protein n=1 Tax=Protopolystoma xenopodis TaxID=117903 RepID=A0A3S5B8M7_9PLAT|nr:unnamed protein product [Protopolystoma xenopodis]